MREKCIDHPDPERQLTEHIYTEYIHPLYFYRSRNGRANEQTDRLQLKLLCLSSFLILNFQYWYRKEEELKERRGKKLIHYSGRVHGSCIL